MFIKSLKLVYEIQQTNVFKKPLLFKQESVYLGNTILFIKWCKMNWKEIEIVGQGLIQQRFYNVNLMLIF